ncbi:unnamed protein product [Boreogadus saida]
MAGRSSDRIMAPWPAPRPHAAAAAWLGRRGRRPGGMRGRASLGSAWPSRSERAERQDDRRPAPPGIAVFDQGPPGDSWTPGGSRIKSLGDAPIGSLVYTLNRVHRGVK